uniref:Inositol monophosphatase 1 n=1 Tax=Nothobranchius kadleci TaxID=1051664 RepID=A0A1A8BH78_NOTKA
MADSLQTVMDYAVAVARKAGEVVQAALAGDRKVMTKSSAVDLVTQTDQKVEKLIIQSVKEKFPTHRFIGEESVAAGEACELTNEPTWIIDPIDGTTNFVHSFPFVAVSIGFSVNKQAYYEIGMHVWDIAAGSLIVSEAGGLVLDVDGGQVDLMSRRVLAANNRSIAEKIVKEIVLFRPPRDDALDHKQ